MTVVIVPLGHGNLGSLRRHLERLGHGVEVWEGQGPMPAGDWLIIPGVGSLPGAERALASPGLRSGIEAWRKQKRPLLGICLGLQLFFGEGEEGGNGFQWLPGEVPRLRAPVLPHIGWNELEISDFTPTWLRRFAGAHVYFVHEFAVIPENSHGIWMTTSYHQPFPSIVGAPGLVGLQFHPELSGSVGEDLTQEILHRGAQ